MCASAFFAFNENDKFMMRQLRVLLAVALSLAAQASFADWDWANWLVGTNGPAVSVLNSNKLSFRVYEFHRTSGALKTIRWNVSRPEEYYVCGESSFVLSCNGKEKKAEFVSFEAREDRTLRETEERDGADVLATATSRYRLVDEVADVFIVYRFRRDNEVQVDCSVVSEKPLPADSTFSLSYPISKEYEIEGLTRDVYKLGLSRPRDDGYASLCFRSRATLGGGKARKMKVSVKARDNVLSPTHDRVLTLCAPLSAPVKSAEGPCKTFDGSWLASFCFSIPRRLSWWW